MCLRSCLAAVLLALSAEPTTAATINFKIVHDNEHPTTLLEATPAGRHQWQPLARLDQLRGGRVTHGSAAFPDGTCLVDIRLTYANDPTITVAGWDLCGHPSVRLAQVRRKALEPIDDRPLLR